MNNADGMNNGNSSKIWRVLKTEPENYDTTSLYLEGNDERFKRRRAGHQRCRIL
jgi:hypothetical protein